MTKIKLDTNQLKSGKREFDNSERNANERLSNAKKMMLSGKRDVKRAAKKTLLEQTERKKEINELQNIFNKAIKNLKSEDDIKKEKEAKAKERKKESAEVNKKILALNRRAKKFTVELNELEIKLILASLKRSANAVKNGKINNTGSEYLNELINDLKKIID